MTHTIIIAGLGRCGSSLLMQMLDAAGVECVGEWPDFEDEKVNDLLQSDPSAWAEAVTGKAVKILEPYRYALPAISGKVTTIWLKRDPLQQAKSMLKMASMVVPVANPRKAKRAFLSSLRPDERASLKAIEKVWGKPMPLDFEVLIKHPWASAFVLQNLLRLPFPKAALMAQTVRPRGTDCLEHMMELSMALERA